MSSTFTTTFALTFLLAVGSAEAQPAGTATTPPGYGPHLELSPPERESIARGAADLGGAVEQSLLSTSLYVSSAATLIGGVITGIVLFAALDPDRLGESLFGRSAIPEWAMLSTSIGCFVVHAITTVLAISVGNAASARHRRARSELLLAQITVSEAGVGVRF